MFADWLSIQIFMNNCTNVYVTDVKLKYSWGVLLLKTGAITLTSLQLTEAVDQGTSSKYRCPTIRHTHHVAFGHSFYLLHSIMTILVVCCQFVLIWTFSDSESVIMWSEVFQCNSLSLFYCGAVVQRFCSVLFHLYILKSLLSTRIIHFRFLTSFCVDLKSHSKFWSI